MKFTDGMFTFPIRVYDEFSLRKASKKEEDTDIAQPADWVRGYADVPLNEIKGIFDYFSKGRDIKEVAEGGFDATYIMTHSLGEFICTWKREKFKENLNKFADDYQATLDKYVQEQLDRKLAEDVQREMDIVEQEESQSERRGFFTSWWKK